MKRANIGCEMLTDPSMILLDEPTSGLDSSSAFVLMENLCRMAKERDKVIIASIHQPSSQLYHMFDDLMLLAKGKVMMCVCVGGHSNDFDLSGCLFWRSFTSTSSFC